MRPYKFVSGTLFGMLVALGPAVSAYADGRTAPSVSFFHGGNGSAHWTRAADATGDTDGFSMELDVPNPSSFAGIDLQHQVGTTAPTTPPSFDFMSSVSGPSGGSPRLVIQFNDGGNIQLRPLTWTANVWTHESGSGTDWDNNGGTCGFQYEKPYNVVTACHAGKTVTDAFIVSDEFAYPNGFTHFIDNISYNGSTISRSGDNSNS